MSGGLGTGILDVCLGAGGLAAIVVPSIAWIFRRSEKRQAELAAAKKVADEATEQQHKHEMAAAIHESVREATDRLRSEMSQRFDANDAATNAVRDDVIKIRATVFPNGGSSLADQVVKARDAAVKAEAAADGVVDRFEDHLKQAEDDRRRIEALESRKP